jgi:two-component system, OmpR family, sensor kinase
VATEPTPGSPPGPARRGRSRRARLRDRIRHPQLRTRVLAGVVAVTLAILAGFGFAAITALHSYLLAQTDGNLRVIAGEYVQVIPKPAAPAPNPFSINGLLGDPPSPIGSSPLIRVYNSAGNPARIATPKGATIIGGPRGPLSQSPRPSLSTLALPSAVDEYNIELRSSSGKLQPVVTGNPDLVPRLPASLATVAAHHSILTVTSRNGRAQLRLTAESRYGYTLIVTTSLQDLDSTLGRLKVIVAAGVLASALLVLAGAGLVVRRGLRPVARMATAADKITAGDLTSRVSPHDPVTEVGRLGTALNGMLDRVQAAVREREASEQATRQFFADASHELRTPLASLRANAELYQQGALPRRPQVDEAMRRITAEARRMGTMVDGMLRLVRLDQHPRQHREPVNLSALAIECIERAQIAAPWHTWQASITAGLVTTGDEEMVRRAIDNLLANIATHTPAGTTASITALASGGVITVEVSDDGPGVPADQLPRIFDRFYRAPAEEHHTGSGLGLAIVTAIAAAHHGTARAALNYPHGLRVTLTFPACRRPAVAQLPAGNSGSSGLRSRSP